MSKHKIVGFRRHQSGIDYHRVTAPLEAMQRDMGVDVKFASDPRDIGEKAWQEATHIVCSRFFSVPLDQMDRFKQACQHYGKKLVVDVDDWWYLPLHHPKHNYYMQKQIPQRIEKALSIADVVWTTTKVLYKKVRKFNKNCYIIPNAVDTKIKQWQHKKLPSKEVRIGYIAGNNHQTDLDAYQIDLSDYKSYTVDIDQYPEMLQVQHVLDPLPAYEYGSLYRHIDVSIIPLIASDFNRCKSHLKLIEAGFTNTAVICSNVNPYSQYLKPEVNCLTPSTPDEWERDIKRMAESKQLVADLAGQLAEDMKDYNMEYINQLRYATL